jgi:hypothetical protein
MLFLAMDQRARNNPGFFAIVLMNLRMTCPLFTGLMDLFSPEAIALQPHFLGEISSCLQFCDKASENR